MPGELMAHRSVAFWLFLVVTLAASESGIDAPARADTVPSGRFVVVDLRAASDVAASAAMREADRAKARLHGDVHFGRTITWTDRRRCAMQWADETGAPARQDRNLSDLQIVPGNTDRRINRSLIVDCSARSAGEIWQVLMIDDRVLVARAGSSTTYLVLEKPLASRDVQRLRHGLQRAGLDPGRARGTIDARARAAIAQYAEQHGAAYHSVTGVITRNVLDSLFEGR